LYLQGGIYLKSIILTALALGVMIGTIVAASSPYDVFGDGSIYAKLVNKNMIVDKNVSFSFDQSVQGTGYYMTYKYAKFGNDEIKDYAHGSGSLDSEAVLSAYQSNHQYHLWNDNWDDYNVSCIQYAETTKATYAPFQFAIGTGYYAANPLKYDSLIKEKTTLKNYLAGSSMQN